MTNAEKHVLALLAQFGPPPFAVPGFGVTVLGLASAGDVLAVRLDDAGKERRWLYPSPEVWVADPAGDLARTLWVTAENGEVVDQVVMGREAPLEIAAVQLARQLERWRAE